MENMAAEWRQTRPTRARFSDNESDLRLLARIAHRDRDAFRELYATYYQPVLRFIHRVTRHFDLAQEGVNDVMLVVWESGNSFGHRSMVSTWIMGIAYRKALKLLEKSRRWSSRVTAVDFDALPERSEVALELIDNADLRDLLDEALRQLSPEQRGVVELTYFHGCSYQDIAVIADCPVNTVKTRMFHARAKLRKLLPALGGDELCA
jgi:RNA polymerase sigma-70 factor (ECF subfamily)